MIRLHLLAPWTGALCQANTADAQIGIARTFATMMQRQGVEVIEYGVAGSETAAAEHVAVAAAGTPIVSKEFDEAVMAAVMMRARHGDVVCHSIGASHVGLVAATKDVIHHVEHAVSYDRPPTENVHRVYASEAWRNWMWGRYHGHAISDYHRGEVIPHAVDPDEWKIATSSHGDEYALFMGRLTATKYGRLPEIVAATPWLRWKIAGPGDDYPFRGLANVELCGSVTGQDRVALVSRSSVMVCPTPYCEPFGLAAIEAGLCGVPIVAPRAGAYPETIDQDYGVLVRHDSVEEWASGIRFSLRMRYQKSRMRAAYAGRFGMQSVGERYLAFFCELPRRYPLSAAGR